MARFLALFGLLWVVSAAGLAAQSVWVMTPMQRGYLRPTIEAELLAPFSFHVPFTAVGFDPLVTTVFVPAPREPARWMSVPATEARQVLAAVYPERLLAAFAPACHDRHRPDERWRDLRDRAVRSLRSPERRTAHA